MADLLEAIIEILFKTRSERNKNLKEFFKFGIEMKKFPDSSPTVEIICPQIHKLESGAISNDYDWHERLLPNVIYEDSRAIEKVRKALHDINIWDSRILTPRQMSILAGNRIWFCMPRNELAQRQLSELGKRVHFEISSREDKRYEIIWKKGNNTHIHVESPLGKYLELSRSSFCENKTEWNYEYGNIYAVDFAVIARFKTNNKDNTAHSDSPFYHYFIAGIRGLGTWGAGWYIDHHAGALSKLSLKKDDLQILLKVEYLNYQIKSVQDVSNKKKEDFERENSEPYIREMIGKHKPPLI